MFYPWEHWPDLERLADRWATSYRPLGEALLAKRELEVKEAVEKAYRFTSAKGTRVVVFEGPALSSDAAELIDKNADIVIAFEYDCETVVEHRGPALLFTEVTQSPRIRLSTRSHTSFDCAAFAKAHGGGGHTKAAGFNLDVHPSDKNPYEYVRELVATWEALQ